jgi:hypothetical protein
MTEALVSKVREYLENVSATYISDAVIERWLNSTRKYVNSKQIYAEDYLYDNESAVYKIGYNGIMNLVLKDGSGDVISTDDYSVDVENGIITFDSSPLVMPDSVYATFNYCNFFNAVAECWKYLAAIARIDGKVKLGDEDLPEDFTSRSYCIRKYWDYCQSENIEMER